jgi:hypothetical protein
MPNNKDKNNIKNKLADLKEQLKSDPVQLDTADLMAGDNVFPVINDGVKYIDYVSEKLQHTAYATQVTNNIIRNYVKSPELLQSPRLNDLKQNDIIKLSQILLMLSITESNLIKLQEFIDSGDVSKEMFDAVNRTQQELRANMKIKDEHLKACENYWSNYANEFGLENEEEQIVAKTIVDTDEKTTIIDLSRLNEIVNDMKEKSNDK